MALQEITFTKQGDVYLSEGFQVNSSAVGIHLEFAASSESNYINLMQSCTGTEFSSFNLLCTRDKIVDVNVLDLIPGQYVKIQTTLQPTLSKYLE